MNGTPVLHVLDHSLPLLSGYSVRSHYLLNAQRAWGLAPVAVTSSKHGRGPERELIDGITYFRTPGGELAGITGIAEMQLMSRLARRLGVVAREQQSRLVHAHSPVLNGLPAYWFAKRAGLPIVYEIRAFWEDAAVDHGTHGEDSARYRLIRALETWLIRRVDAVGVISRGLAQEVAARGVPPERIFRIPNGVDPEIFRPAPRDSELERRWGLENKLVIGFMGSFYRYEGVDTLLQAFAKMASDVPAARLLLIGAGEAVDELRAQARRLGIESRTVFAGSVPHTESRRCYSVFDVLVYPRKSMRLTELVTPLKPLEAMASGRAVVASDVGGLRELIEDGSTGLLFPHGQPDELAVILRRLAGDAELRRTLGDTARDFVCRERDWRTLTAVYPETYRKVLNGNRSCH